MDYPITNGVTQLPTSNARLMVLDRITCGLYIKKGYQLKMLEIGSLYGDSARVLERYGSVLCIDKWDFSDGLERFRMNTAGLKVETLQGSSQDILPLIEGASFDLVYVDGCHTYPTVEFDIRQAKRLVKSEGIICGDDFEKPIITMADYLEAEGHKTTDYYQGYHPGVSLALYKEFRARVNDECGLWWVNT